MDTVDGDPVLAADNRDVPDRHVVRAHDDAAAHDRARLADEDLTPRDHERTPVHSGVETDDRCTTRVGGRPRARQCKDDGERGHESHASELAALFRIPEPQQRKPGLSEYLREQPAAAEKGQCLPERRHHAEHAHQAEQDAELDRAERERGPGGLVAQQPVVGEDVERQPDRGHQPDSLNRPPAVQDRRQHARRRHHRQERREPRLDPSSQRVRHALTLRRNPCPT